MVGTCEGISLVDWDWRPDWRVCEEILVVVYTRLSSQLYV